MLEIIRLEYGDEATIGVLKLDGKLFCYTLEDPWNNNEKFRSCIPEGDYLASRFMSTRFGPTFKLLTPCGDEPSPRDGILFHAGNTHVDTTGCVLLGSDVGMLNGTRAVLASKKAFDKFIKTMGMLDECDCRITSFD